MCIRDQGWTGRDGRHGDRRAWPRAGSPRLAGRRDGVAAVRHQRRGARTSQARRRESRVELQTGGAADRMIVLFWDIDGTLLTTGKAGVPAWEQAVREICLLYTS